MTLARRARGAMQYLSRRFATPETGGALPAPDPRIIRRSVAVAEPICTRYFRSEVRCLDRVPPGQTMLVGHHDGGLLPIDALCFGLAWHRRFDVDRPLRALMHEIPFHVSRPLARWLHGIGVVSAAPANLEALLDAGHDVLLYPGAAREAFRPFAQRRNIDLGGRTGFVRRALRRGLPLTPIVSAGAHETFFILRRGARVAHWIGIDEHFRADAWPLAVGLPWGLWFGPMVPYLPLPSKITVEVLPSIDLRDELSRRLGREIGAAQADDADVVRAGYELVRDAMRAGVGRLYDERRHVVLG